VEAHCQRLDQAKVLERQHRRIDLRRRHRNQPRHRAIALHTKRLIVAAGVLAAAAARRAHTAAGVRRHRNARPCSHRAVAVQHGRGNLMAQHARVRDQRITPAKRVQIGPAQTDHLHLQQQIARRTARLGDLGHLHIARVEQRKSFHPGTSNL
jgi:hypothetical protein